MDTDLIVLGGLVGVTVMIGWVVVRYVLRTISFLVKLVLLVAVGLFVGRLLGTTYTHAFDIMWWWKGLGMSLPLVAGGLLAGR